MILIWLGTYLLLGTVLGDDFQCPKDEFDLCMDGDYPLPGDCTLYYHCTGCQKYVKECPSAMYFNENIQQCQDKALVHCNQHYAINGSAFCIAMESTADGPLDNLILTEVILNDNAYNTDTGIYTASTEGVYFFHVSAGARPSVQIDVNIDFGQAALYNVKRQSTAHSVDVLSRDFLIDVPISASFGLALGTNSGTGYRTSSRATLWTGFRLQEYMESVQAFSATRDANAGPGRIIFDNSVVDIGNVYDPVTGSLKPTQGGIYYLTFSTGINAGTGTHQSRFVSSVKGPICELNRQFGNHNQFDSLSRSVLVNLNVDEELYIDLIDGQAVNTQDTMLSFSGFLYRPLNTDAKAWSVHRTSSISGPTSIITFNEVDVNEGALFDIDSHRVTISVAGAYFITMSVGAVGGQSVDVDMVAEYGNDEVIEAKVERVDPYHDDTDTLSRSIMLDLPVGCVLHLRRNTPSHIYSDIFHQTSWSGFLLAESKISL